MPGKNQCMIKVHYSTVNPFDRTMKSMKQTDGYVLGSDGCGIVMACGDDVDKSMVGKKVSFFGGAYSRYVVKDANMLMVFEDDFDLKEAASAFVNPMTVMNMLDIIQREKA